MASNANSPTADTPATIPNATTPPSVEDAAIIESRRNARINENFNVVINSNVNMPTDPQVIQEIIQSHRHVLLALKEDNFYSKAAVVQAVTKSTLCIPSATGGSRLREAKGDEIRQTRERQQAESREAARVAREAREEACQQREAARQQRQAARQAAQQEARGHVGYDIQGGVTKIGRNYM